MSSLWKKNAGLDEYVDHFFNLLQKNVGRSLENFMDDRFPVIKNGLMAWRPHVDLHETEKEFILKADLPGIEKKDVIVEISDEILTICGERLAEDRKDNDKNHWKERFHGKFCRSISIPEDVIDHQKIDAEFENGVLTISMKKKPKHTSKHKRDSRRLEIK